MARRDVGEGALQAFISCPSVCCQAGAGIYLGFHAKLIKLLISQKQEVRSWHRVKLLHLSKASSKGYSVCLHSHEENLVKLCLRCFTAVPRAPEEHAVRRDALERCYLVRRSSSRCCSKGQLVGSLVTPRGPSYRRRRGRGRWIGCLIGTGAAAKVSDRGMRSTTHQVCRRGAAPRAGTCACLSFPNSLWRPALAWGVFCLPPPIFTEPGKS